MQILANGQPHEIEEGKRFTCIVHQQGIRVDVPEAVDINSRQTIECMEKMNQRQWEHISTGQLFRILFSTVFPKEDHGGAHDPDEGESNFPKPQTRFFVDVPVPDDASPDQGFGEAAAEAQALDMPPKPPKTERWVLDLEPGIPIPASIEELQKGDFGVMHVAGMITLGCEAIFEGKTRLFFRTPEDHLHPKAERRIVDMLRKMMYLAGATGTVTEEVPVSSAAAGIAGGLPPMTAPPAPEPPQEPKPPPAKKPPKKPAPPPAKKPLKGKKNGK
jgi:hypothetical protein